MTHWEMDKPAIKEAAEVFMMALVDWKAHLWKTVPTYLSPPSTWTIEEENVFHQAQIDLIDYVIQAYIPIYNMTQVEAIDEPFDFMGYMMGQIGRVLGDELSYPEITKPYYKFCDSLMGGMTDQEFWETDYYKKHLLPKNFEQFEKPKESDSIDFK